MMALPSCRSLFLAISAFLLSGSALTAQIVPDILYLRFEEGSGTVVNDAAYPGTGTIGNLTPFALLTSGNAALGSGSLRTGITAADGCIFANPQIASTLSYTVEFWIEVWGGGGEVFPYGQFCNPATSFFGLRITNVSPGSFDFQIWSNAATFAFAAVPLTGVNGNWCHIAITSDAQAASLTLFVNSIPYASLPLTTFADLQPLIAGGLNIGGQLSSNCAVGAPTVQTGIDDFRIWSTARTPAQIMTYWASELGTGGDFLGSAAPPVLTFDTSLSTFTASGVANLGGSQSSPTLLPGYLLPPGTTMNVTGGFTGTDIATLSDITFAPVTIRFTAAPSVDELIIQGLVSAAAGPLPTTRFAGTSGIVVTRRALTSAAPPIVTRIGQGSVTLNSFATRLQSASAWSLVVDYGITAPSVVGIAAPYIAPSVIKESRLTTDGFGAVLLGDIGMAPGARLFHIFALQPATAVGTGPFFGLEWTPVVFTQVQLPFPVTPFKVAADSAGAFMYLGGPGTLPAGFTVDTVTIELPPPNFGIGWISPARRVVF